MGLFLIALGLFYICIGMLVDPPFTFSLLVGGYLIGLGVATAVESFVRARL